MQYDPRSASSRRHLAESILQVLSTANFIEEWHDDPGDITRERVFYFPVLKAPGVRILVYTSIVNDEVREVGKDAIRIVAVYKSKRDDKEKGIVSTTRVNRVGDVDAIAQRVLERMRTVYKKAVNPDRCPHCGAPMFISRKGNRVCAEICWEEKGPAVRSVPFRASVKAERGFRSRRWA